DDWSVMYFNRFIGDMRDSNTNDNVGDILYHNISGTYHVNDTTILSLGIKNFTDEKPVTVSNGSDGGTVPEVYDTIGRTIYGGVTVKF
ncbi:MAG: TonB-dependent receptor, partial [Shewanella sp.]